VQPSDPFASVPQHVLQTAAMVYPDAAPVLQSCS
jgi:hypothetical protein